MIVAARSAVTILFVLWSGVIPAVARDLDLFPAAPEVMPATVADADGDGKTDLAVWRPSTGEWYLLTSSTNFTTFAAVQWGLPGDRPVLARQ